MDAEAQTANRSDATGPPKRQCAAWWYHSTGRDHWSGGHMAAACREHPGANIRHTKDMRFDEYAGEACVIYANWNPHTQAWVGALKELKQWIDSPDAQRTNPTTIIVTSCYTMEQCMCHPEQLNLINWMLRRFRVRVFPAPGGGDDHPAAPNTPQPAGTP